MTVDPGPEPLVRLEGRQAPSQETELVKVLISEEARDAVDAHVALDTRVESGGILAGTYDERTHRVRVVAAIPARQAVGALSSLTFTHEAWDEVNDVLAAEHPDLRMVGWYHSHPHFGIFLSEYDLFIHRNFFSEPWQVAYVVDPLLGQAGFFGWRHGAIEQHASWYVRAQHTARSVPPTPPETRRAEAGQAEPRAKTATRPPWVVLGLAVAVVAFVVGFLVHRPAGPPTTQASTPFAHGSLKGTRAVTITGSTGMVTVTVTNEGTSRSPGATVTDCAAAGSLDALPVRGGVGARVVTVDGAFRCAVPPLAGRGEATFTFKGTGQAALEAAVAAVPVMTFDEVAHPRSDSDNHLPEVRT